MNTEEANVVKNKYNELMATLDSFESSIFNKWAESIIDESEANLNKPLIVRQDDLLNVNFDPKVVALLREVKYFEALGVKSPETAANIYAKAEVFRKNIFSLDHISTTYNGIRTGVLDVERPLILSKIEEIDAQIQQGLTSINWKSENIEQYITDISTTVGNLNSILQVTKNNVIQIQTIMKKWFSSPLIDRKDGKKLLNLEEKEAKLAMAYDMIKKDGQTIHDLVQSTCKVLEADPESDIWGNYRKYVDTLVKDGFWSTIKTSLEYLTENMDREKIAGKEVGPLLEAKLELDNEMLVYTPGMEEGNVFLIFFLANN
jgi:dynein heavy chain, axonemal